MSSKFFLLVVLTAISLMACQSNEQQSLFQPQMSNHISQSVYEIEFDSALQFHKAMIQLQDATVRFCQQETDFAEVTRVWQQGMQRWMWLQGQERGPATALEQNWNIQFWPDKKNTTGRKMLAASKQRTWTVELLQRESVTVQGLGAFEWLLFDTASSFSQGDMQNCTLALAVSGALASRSQTVVIAWQSNPWTELNEADWHAEYLALLANQLDYSMKKLSRPLAKIGVPRPYFSESWRSKTSLINLQTNVEALQALYFAKGTGLDYILRHQGAYLLADSIAQQFERILVTWPDETSVFDMLQTKSGYQSALSLFNKLEQLKYLISEEASVELGVVIGFNATDGD
ncbi:imelysin family protein [Vibrio hangzhouensis]|uniref:imelysin family protein n=1 Tax=Vibrio hangzhouensis TaxID=462991 RepID=UPI0039657CD2